MGLTMALKIRAAAFTKTNRLIQPTERQTNQLRDIPTDQTNSLLTYHSHDREAELTNHGTNQPTNGETKTTTKEKNL